MNTCTRPPNQRSSYGPDGLICISLGNQNLGKIQKDLNFPVRTFAQEKRVAGKQPLGLGPKFCSKRLRTMFCIGTLELQERVKKCNKHFNVLYQLFPVQFECCGVNGYNDWNDNIYFNCSQITTEACGVPSSCCIKDRENKQCGYGLRKKVESDPPPTVLLCGVVQTCGDTHILILEYELKGVLRGLKMECLKMNSYESFTLL